MQYVLQLVLQDAILTRDVETFSKMDPYVRFQLNKIQQTSKTVTDGGKTPKWNENFEFLVSENDRIDFSVIDAEESDKDRIVGSGVLLVESLVANNKTLEDFPLSISIFWKDKESGKVNFQWVLKLSEKDQLTTEIQKERKIREVIEQEKAKLESQITELLESKKKIQLDFEKEKQAYAELDKLFEAKSKEIDAKTSNLHPDEENNQNLKLLLDQEKAANKKNLEKLEQDRKSLISENTNQKKEIDELNNALSAKSCEIEGGKKEIENLNNLVNSLPKVVSDEKVPVKVGAGFVVGVFLGALALKLLKK